MTRRVLVPLVAGVLGLSGSLGTTWFLHRAASTALERVLEERLRGADCIIALPAILASFMLGRPA